jgi:hypothetical protein
VLSGTVKKSMIPKIEKILRVKSSRKTFITDLDRPSLYYEVHRKCSNFWEDMSKMSIAVFTDKTDKNFGVVKRKWTKVS